MSTKPQSNELDRLILLDTYVNEFWVKKDKRLSRILKVMDNVEFWVMEEEESFAQAINKMGSYLGEATPVQIEQVVDNLITIMAYMSSSKAIRMSSWLAEKHPEVFGKCLARIPSHKKPKAAKLLNTRMRILNTLDLTNKVFNPNRSQMISSWLRSQVAQETN